MELEGVTEQQVSFPQVRQLRVDLTDTEAGRRWERLSSEQGPVRPCEAKELLRRHRPHAVVDGRKHGLDTAGEDRGRRHQNDRCQHRLNGSDGDLIHGRRLPR